MGRLSHQVKLLHETTSPRIIPASSTAASRMPESREEHPEGKKKTLEPTGMPWKPQSTSMN
jgi:hypothetical protein